MDNSMIKIDEYDESAVYVIIAIVGVIVLLAMAFTGRLLCDWFVTVALVVATVKSIKQIKKYMMLA